MLTQINGAGRDGFKFTRKRQDSWFYKRKINSQVAYDARDIIVIIEILSLTNCTGTKSSCEIGKGASLQKRKLKYFFICCIHLHNNLDLIIITSLFLNGEIAGSLIPCELVSLFSSTHPEGDRAGIK